MSNFTHINKKNNPKMVNVSDKKITKRTAIAKATMFLGKEVISHFTDDELVTKKGPVFQTAIIAGIQGVKKTSDIIPMCHPLLLSGINCDVTELPELPGFKLIVTAKLNGQTGVEMEALTGATVAALTIYDMCKAFSHDIIIESTQLMSKSGGKRDFERS